GEQVDLSNRVGLLRGHRAERDSVVALVVDRDVVWRLSQEQQARHREASGAHVSPPRRARVYRPRWKIGRSAERKIVSGVGKVSVLAAENLKRFSTSSKIPQDTGKTLHRRTSCNVSLS